MYAKEEFSLEEKLNCKYVTPKGHKRPQINKLKILCGNILNHGPFQDSLLELNEYGTLRHRNLENLLI